MNNEKLNINHWQVDTVSGEVRYLNDPADGVPRARIDPKGIELLRLLASAHHEIFDKSRITEAVWPNQIVTDDALTRCVSRLRKALNDNPRDPNIIETVPKRGYRMIAQSVSWQPASTAAAQPVNPLPAESRRRWLSVGLMFCLVAVVFTYYILRDSTPLDDSDFIINQADDLYLQMRRQDNEMAIELYQRAIALRPDSGIGQAGLANAIVQQVIRWPNTADQPPVEHQSLSDALAEGRTQSAVAVQKLERALVLAQRAVRIAPNDPRTHKALGFVYSAQGKLTLAQQHYLRAIELDSQAWQAMINMGDVLEIDGQLATAIGYYERAFMAMSEVYREQSAQIQPWYADMGALIGDKHQLLKQTEEAEAWYRRVLGFAPFNQRATQGLANLLIQRGEKSRAQQLCEEYQQRVGTNPCRA